MRNNPYREGIEELFDRSGISPEAVHGLVVAGHEGIPASDEKLLRIASYLIPLAQEAVYREHEAAVGDYDEAFVPCIPQSFFEDSSEALEPGFIEKRFGEVQ